MKTLLSTALCLLCACKPVSEGGAVGADAAAAAAEPVATPPAEELAALPPRPPPPRLTPLVALDGEGLRLVDPASGATRLLAFGVDLDQVTSSLGNALVPPTEESSDDCGGTVWSFGNGLQLHTRDSRWLGWSLRDGAKFSTMSGTALGTTRDKLAEASTIDMLEDSTLGDEFSVGGIAGLFASGAKDAPITHLWAGETCIAR